MMRTAVAPTVALAVAPPPDLYAEAEQRQYEAWIAAGVRLCPFSLLPCDCAGLPKEQRCL